ncbi:23109_t:CDS:1, partial [Racocetra persica]
VELNDRKSIDIYKKDLLVPNYEIVNANNEDYIFYKKAKYTINDFLENLQKEDKSLNKDNCLLNNYLFHEHKNIHEGILALQKDIENLEKWHLRKEFKEY